MQQLNWNDFRYLLALERGRTLSGAARILSVDETTVSRRLKVLRDVLSTELYGRTRDGHLVLTDVGSAIAERAANMEWQTDQIAELVGDHERQLSGTVRVTSVPFLTNRWIAKHVGALLAQHPALTVELNPDNRDLDLNLREADLALRLSRPRRGGSSTLSRRIASLPFGVFASRELSRRTRHQLPWIGYDETMSHLPQAQWIAREAKSSANALSRLTVTDMETALEATVAGVGRTLLPIPIAGRMTTLIRLDSGEPKLSREIWLLRHRNQSEMRRMQVVVDWLEQIMRSRSLTTAGFT